MLDDAALWEQFGAAALPAAAWNHHAHLRMAWLFLARHPLDDAHILLRVGIIRLNASHGLVETPTRGYHETLTVVWLSLVAACRADAAAADSPAFLARHAPALGKDVPLRHYSRDRLFSAAARARFVAPDLAPLPF